MTKRDFDAKTKVNYGMPMPSDTRDFYGVARFLLSRRPVQRRFQTVICLEYMSAMYRDTPAKFRTIARQRAATGRSIITGNPGGPTVRPLP